MPTGSGRGKVTGMNPDVVNRSLLDELRWIDSELVRVDLARDWLVRRRMELLAEMTATPPPLPAPPLSTAGPAGPRRADLHQDRAIAPGRRAAAARGLR